MLKSFIYTSTFSAFLLPPLHLNASKTITLSSLLETDQSHSLHSNKSTSPNFQQPGPFEPLHLTAKALSHQATTIVSLSFISIVMDCHESSHHPSVTSHQQHTLRNHPWSLHTLTSVNHLPTHGFCFFFDFRRSQCCSVTSVYVPSFIFFFSFNFRVLLCFWDPNYLAYYYLE